MKFGLGYSISVRIAETGVEQEEPFLKIKIRNQKSDIKFDFLIASQPRWSCKGQLISESNFGVFKSPKKLTKFLTDFCPSFIASEINHGPLNTWTEHSNCQIHSRGDSKTLIVSLIPHIFLILLMKLFFYAYKS